MHVGFTGTRQGMTPAQKQTVENILGSLWAKETVVHHGCCVGADADFHAIAKRCGLRVVGHPAYAVGEAMRADLECDELRAVLPPLERNAVIVEETLFLIATPLEDAEVTRSGTWATIRKSRDADKARCVITPDGKGDHERVPGVVASVSSGERNNLFG